MRLTLVASLALCGLICTGCESLNKTVRLPGKKPVMPEQLTADSKRREESEKQVAQASTPAAADKAVQQTSLSPATAVSTELDAILLKAKQAEQAQQLQVAKTLYDQVLQKQPQNAEAHHRLGVLADQDGRYPEAQQHYQQAIKLEPQNASLLSDIGYSFYSQDRLDDAEKHLNLALLIQPGNQYARNNLAHVYGRRAQQTGSATDYKLAEEQFLLALGPQGAEAQMKQLFPQGGPATDKRGAPNPFKKSDKAMARAGSNLQAPKPKSEDGNEQLLRQMADIRRQMEQNGEIPPKAAAMAAGGRPNSQSAVPFDQMNQVLSQIDNGAEAQRQQALRESYPGRARSAIQATPAGWNQGEGIEQTGNWNDPQAAALPPMDRSAYGAQNAQGGQGGQGPRNGQPNGGNYPPGGGQQPNGNWANGGGAYNQYQDGPGGQFNGQTAEQNRGARPAAADAPPSWPDAQGSPTQFDARGNSWDGQTVMNGTPAARDPNMLNGQNDPNYRVVNGQSFGPQRPNGGNRPNPNAWNEGRQAAAQLGLDAGMGEMFPGGDNDPAMNGMYQQGYPQGNPQMGSPAGNGRDNWGEGDASMAPIPTTQRGLPPGGNGMQAPADYYYSQPGYQNNGYSQGVNPTMGDNFGQQGGDVSAPWNQGPTTQRSSRGAAPAQSQYGNDAGATQGRFAPARQTGNAQPQNFGAPPMYYGR